MTGMLLVVHMVIGSKGSDTRSIRLKKTQTLILEGVQ